MNTELHERSKTVKELTRQGFRIQFSNHEYTLLCRDAPAQTLHIARVNDDGKVFQKTLSEFLAELLDDGNS